MEERKVPFAYGAELQAYFAQYLTKVRGLSASSVRHYQDALNTISRYMRERHLVQRDIYEVGSIEQLHARWGILSQDEDFMQLNRRGHQMYSAGYRRYNEFVQGEGILGQPESLMALDAPMAVAEPAHIAYQVFCAHRLSRRRATNVNFIRSTGPLSQRPRMSHTWRRTILSLWDSRQSSGTVSTSMPMSSACAPFAIASYIMGSWLNDGIS